MDSRDSFTTTAEWKTLLWQVTAGAIVLGLVVVGLSALMRFMFVVGILYGLALIVVTFVVAQSAMRVEFQEPADPIEESSAIAFPFSFMGGYPQLIFLMTFGFLTVVLAPSVSLLTGNLGVSSGPTDDTDDTSSSRIQIPPADPATTRTIAAGTAVVEAVTTSANWSLRHNGTKAFDKNAQTYWNTGSPPPGWIEADLGKSVSLKRIRLVLYTAPACRSVHELWISDKPIERSTEGANNIHTFDAFYQRNDILEFSFPAETQARYLQVRTTTSQSWPSWYEIVIDKN